MQLYVPGPEKLITVTGNSAVNVIDGNPHHVAATIEVSMTGGSGGASSQCTVTLYVDGQAQQPASFSVGLGDASGKQLRGTVRRRH